MMHSKNRNTLFVLWWSPTRGLFSVTVLSGGYQRRNICIRRSPIITNVFIFEQRHLIWSAFNSAESRRGLEPDPSYESPGWALIAFTSSCDESARYKAL